jgi:3-oxoacyl-[acyl-carrier-protein] synthase-3
MVRSIIEGVGSALPKRIMTNADISKIVDTTDQWIVERTGIRARHIAAEDETTRSLAVQSARNALEHAKLKPADIDLIIVATSTPDKTFPATATQVQADLGITRGAAFDVQAVCSGFVYGLTIADNFIKGGQSQCALVIGSETFSRILDWNDRTTCVLFGDGAGAVVVRAAKGVGTNDDRGILGCHIHSDGRYCDKLYVDGGLQPQNVGHLRMEGREVFKHAVTNIAAVMEETITKAGLKPMDIDWFVPHQARSPYSGRDRQEAGRSRRPDRDDP